MEGTGPDEAALRAAARLATSIEALGAVAASIRVRAEGLDADPDVARLLDAVVEEVGAGDVAALDPATGDAIVGMARAFLLLSGDLVAHPARAGGWDTPDPALLQSIGRMSATVAGAVGAAEGVLDGLGDRLRADGARFLDVGTGTGWLAMAMARTHPALHVVGIDIFEPSLMLARQNVRTAGLGDRVELREADAAALAPDEAFDAIWLPLPFLPEAELPAILSSCVAALAPGGWLLPGTFAGQGDRLSTLLVELRTVRSGGRHWTAEDLLPRLTAAGLADAQEVPRSWAAPVHLFAARRP